MENIINAREAANYVGLSVSRIYKLTMQDKIPCYRPTGGKLYFDKEELNKWVRANRKEATL